MRETTSDDALVFRTTIAGTELSIDLVLRGRGPVLAQGADAARPGYSQKGPQATEASRYYSVPQLAVTGRIARGRAAPEDVTGRAWLDREWSSAYLDPAAAGWDWTGLNLDDGGALMAFRMRDRSGATLWAGGTRRHADGRVERYPREAVRFTPLRRWSSTRSGASWPVAQRIEAGDLALVVEPLMDDQELDSRASTGTIYWEGAVQARRDDASRAPLGRGYLELTGYWKPIRLGFD